MTEIASHQGVRQRRYKFSLKGMGCEINRLTPLLASEAGITKAQCKTVLKAFFRELMLNVVLNGPAKIADFGVFFLFERFTVYGRRQAKLFMSCNKKMQERILKMKYGDGWKDVVLDTPEIRARNEKLKGQHERFKAAAAARRARISDEKAAREAISVTTNENPPIPS